LPFLHLLFAITTSSCRGTRMQHSGKPKRPLACILLWEL